MRTIQDNLIDYRMKEGLTQEQLANRLYVTRQAVSKWERGEAYPDLEKIIELSVLYDVSIDELLKGVPYLKKPYRIHNDMPVFFKVFLVLMMVLFIALALSNAIPIVILVFVFFGFVALLSMRYQELVLYRNEWKLKTSRNLFYKVFKRTKSDLGQSYDYNSLKSMEIVYIARKRIGVRDMGMDVFNLIFTHTNGTQVRFEVNQKLCTDLPTIADFLAKKGVIIKDKWDVLDVIRNNEPVYETLHLKQLGESIKK